MDETWLWVVGGVAVFLVLAFIGSRYERLSGRPKSSYTSPFEGLSPDRNRAAFMVAMHADIDKHKARWRRGRLVWGVVIGMVVLGLVGLGVYLFGSHEFHRALGGLVARFGGPVLFLVFGIGGIANAKRLVDIENYWTLPYTISLLFGFVGLLVGVVSLVSAW